MGRTCLLHLSVPLNQRAQEPCGRLLHGNGLVTRSALASQVRTIVQRQQQRRRREDAAGPSAGGCSGVVNGGDHACQLAAGRVNVTATGAIQPHHGVREIGVPKGASASSSWPAWRSDKWFVRRGAALCPTVPHLCLT